MKRHQRRDSKSGPATKSHHGARSVPQQESDGAHFCASTNAARLHKTKLGYNGMHTGSEVAWDEQVGGSGGCVGTLAAHLLWSGAVLSVYERVRIALVLVLFSACTY